MLKPDDNVLKALAELRHNSHYSVVLDWIARSERDSHKKNVKERDEVLFKRRQGELIALSVIQDLSVNAADILREKRESSS